MRDRPKDLSAIIIWSVRLKAESNSLNNFAVSSDGLAIALQDSASALMEGGNNLEQAVALIAAANKVVQDPNSVGSALRTISLRLRGTSVEVLDELGEETDGVVESTSKLQEKIKALSGVNILTDSGGYKDTYTILKEIGAVWEDMNDIDKSALLELMAGKNRANTLAAILGNMEDLEGAYQSALKSEGSALRENEAYLDSIQGRIDLFTNALQTFWMNFINTSVIKGIVDLGTKLIQLLDTVHGKMLAVVAALMVYKRLKDGVKFADMFKGTANIFKEAYSAIILMTSGTKSLTGATLTQTLVTKTNNEELAKEILTKAGLVGVTGKLTKEQIKTTAATLSEAFANGKLTASQYLVTMSTMGLKTALQGLWTVLMQNPVMLVAAVVAAAALAFDHFHTTAQEAADAAKEAFDEIQSVVESTKSTIQSLESELSTLQDKINDLDGKKLSFAEDQELEKLKKQREELEHSLKVQEQLLELQRESSNKQAVASMKAYTKAASEGAQETQETAKTWGTIGGAVAGLAAAAGILLAIPSGGLSLGATVAGVGAMGVAGGVAGNKIGEAVGSGIAANEGTYDSWYETYTKALETSRKEEQKALEKYQKDSSNIDKLDKWQEAQQKTSDIETEMYEHLSQMQQYFNDLEYGISDEIDKELDAWYNFLDKFSIDQGASGAEVTALDRIFGENASEEIQLLKEQILDAVSAGKDFDFTSAINGSQELKNTLDYVGLSAEDVKNYFTQIGESAANAANRSKEITSFKTYSELSAEAENYKEILSQSVEIIAENVKVTQDYKDSLIDLVGSEEAVNECFYEDNKLVVKNEKALKDLLKQARNNISNNTKLAKSQSRLKYYELVKQLNNTLKGTKQLDKATRDSIYTLLDQIDTVELAIYKYQLLENSLLGATNAFEEFAKAQELDALNTYGDSYVEMAQTMYDAFYKTGQVGTEAFWAATEALVPRIEYAGLESDAEKIKAIFDYFRKSIAPTLQLDEDEFSINYKAIEEFIEDGLSVGVFKGNTTEFDLVEGMNLEKAAELMGMTKAQAYALFAELDKYNFSSDEPSFLSQLDDSLEGRIMRITSNLEELNKQKLALLEDGGYEKNKEAIDGINTEIQKTTTELNKAGKEAYDMWKQYTENEAALASLEAIEDKQTQLTKEQATTWGVEWDEEKGLTVQQAYDMLLEKKTKLEEPTVMTAELAIENIFSQIGQLERLLQNYDQLTTIALKFDISEEELKEKINTRISQLKEDAASMAATFGIDLNEEDQQTIEEQLESIEEIEIHDKRFKVVATGLSSTLNQVRELLRLSKELADMDTPSTSGSESTGFYVSNGYHPTGSGGRTMKYADGTFHIPNSAFADGSVGAPKTETALVGELGPEMLVRNGRWTTIGEDGAEFTQVKKGDIIFNHEQTKSLLKNGYITSRGKAFASGTAYGAPWPPVSPDKSLSNDPGNNLSDKDNNSGDDELKDEFEEYFDWIEVKLEEINDSINLNGAKLENAVGASAQNAIIDDMIAGNQELYSTLVTAADAYYRHAQDLLAKVPADLREAAKNGQIAIELFTKDAGEEAINAIQEYREWVQKGDEATQQAEETIAEIRSLAKQAFDNIATDYENQRSLRDNRIDQLESSNALSEAKYGSESTAIYEALIKNNKGNIALLQEQRNAMQANLNAQVRSGDIKKYSQDWYDAVNDIAAVDNEIIELTADTYDYIDAMGEIHWNNLDNVLSRFEAISNEVENLLDILDNKDMVDEAGNWTDEGITSLGLYAQQMEIAEVQAKKYQDEIAYLNKNWKSLGLTEQEYVEKLDELKSGQYDSIKAYHEAKNAIVDLNKTRVDAIKNGIEKEIDAYEELIQKKKEALDADKDLYDFEKSVNEQQKNIATIERKLAALATDNSTSAAAQRKKLEEELLEAKGELEDTFYERSIQNQQNALDKELENFQNSKEEEMEGWDEYLENTEQVVSDSLATIQANTDVVYQTLKSMGQEYGLTIAETLTSPWRDGEAAIQSYAEQFGLSMSSTVEELQKLAIEYEKIMKEIEGFGEEVINRVEQNAQSYVSANNSSSKDNKPSSPSKDTMPSRTPTEQQEETKSITVGGKINAGSARIYANSDGGGGSKQYFSSDPIYVVLGEQNGYLKVRHHSVSSGVTGWFKKSDVKAYAKGTTGVPSDQIAWLDELGEELVMHADGNGRLAFLSKGTSVIPANLTKNLMKLGELNPQDILDRSRPIISAPHIVNNEISIDMSFGSVVNVEHVDNDTLPDLAKTVEQQMDKYMKKLNSEIRKYAR